MVKPGYKQTEVRMIPDEWSLAALNELGTFSKGKGIKKTDVVENGLPCIRYGELYTHHNDIIRKFYSNISFEIAVGSVRLKKGDILFAGSGETAEEIGKCAAFLGEEEAYAGGDIIILSPIDQHERFLGYLLNSYAIAKQKERFGQGDAVVHISSGNLGQIVVPIPPIHEQEAIASALSDVDALIESLERLIAKKRDIKRATMQELLTGKKRLPGFEGEWEKKTLGDICEISMGRTPSRQNDAYWGLGFPWLTIADICSKIVNSSNEEITEVAASEMKIVPRGTLLMSFKLSIGRLCFAGCDLFTNEAICSFNKLRANAEFLYYSLSRTDFSYYGKQAVKGYTLNMESLKSVEVYLPSVDEQAAIATILADLDLDIESLVARLVKVRGIKQGMMQELLTGRIRLV